MRFKVYYRKNLKMSPGKLAAQVAHLACKAAMPWNMPCVVLSLTDAKFDELKPKAHAIIADAGRTEVAKGTETCFGFFEETIK